MKGTHGSCAGSGKQPVGPWTAGTATAARGIVRDGASGTRMWIGCDGFGSCWGKYTTKQQDASVLDNQSPETILLAIGFFMDCAHSVRAAQRHVPLNTGTRLNKRLIFIILPIAVLVLGYVLMQVLADMREEPTRRRPPIIARSVEARVIETGAVPTTIEAIGRVSSTQPVQLVSEVAGLLQSGDVSFLPGQRFRKGQVLLRIDDRQVRYNLNSAKSDFLNVLATVLPELKIEYPGDYQRWQDYFDKCSFERPLGPLPESQDRKVRLLLTRFNVHKLYFTVKNLEVTLEKHAIVAPFNGAIVSTAVREGSAARVGGALGEIISLENLELQAPIPAGDVSWIDRTRPVRLTAEGSDVAWSGSITRIGSAVDQRTQTIPVFIAVRGGGEMLYEGMYLRAEIPGTPLPSAISVPRRALYEERYVYVIDGGTLQRRDVTIARRQPRSVLVSAGLQQGDTLVTELLQGVSDGMPAAALLGGTKGRDE